MVIGTIMKDCLSNEEAELERDWLHDDSHPVPFSSAPPCSPLASSRPLPQYPLSHASPCSHLPTSRSLFLPPTPLRFPPILPSSSIPFSVSRCALSSVDSSEAIWVIFLWAAPDVPSCCLPVPFTRKKPPVTAPALSLALSLSLFPSLSLSLSLSNSLSLSLFPYTYIYI